MAKKLISVHFVDCRTGAAFGHADVPFDQLPVSFAPATRLQIGDADWEVVVANLSDPDQGLPSSLLNRADVLVWWGHQKHGQVTDETVARIVRHVKERGMGFIFLHSSHFAMPNKALMGTACSWGAYVGDSTTLDERMKVARDARFCSAPDS